MRREPTSPQARSHRFALALVVSLFFLWGLANNLNDILIVKFRQLFNLGDFAAGLVQSAFYLGYFVIALPAAEFMRRHGYRRAIALGLALYAAGALLFYPAAQASSYGFFLVALFVIASGLAFLETAANPLVVLLGPAQSAESRLGFAQAWNPLGSLAGILIGRNFILGGAVAGGSVRPQAVETPYLVLAGVVAVWAVIVWLTEFPSIAERGGPQPDAKKRWHRVLGVAPLRFAFIAQFAYVGTQVGVWSYLIRYATSVAPALSSQRASDYLFGALAAFMAGRFAGSWLMRVVDPARLLALFAGTNVLLTVVAVAVPGACGIAALITSSFFMSIMYPTIFAFGIRGRGDGTPVAAAVLVMAIIGGALLPPAMGAISDRVGLALAYLIPAGGYAIVFAFARYVTARP